MHSSAVLAEVNLEQTILEAWDKRDTLSPATEGEIFFAVTEAMSMLDRGILRVADPIGDGWRVNEWLKKAILLYFRLMPMCAMGNAPDGTAWWDKVAMKCAGWSEAEFQAAGFRSVPGAVVRHSAYIAPGAVLMPCFVNVGAHVGENTMIDTWATVGSCAQIGRNCHISGGTGIGGVLEPLQAAPVIIEDDVFIGARSEVAEGVRVCRGAVLSMGVFLGASTKIVDRASGQIHQGVVPPYSVVVPGSLPAKNLPDGSAGPSLSCAVIVKTVDAQTRSKTGLNELLRD